MTDTQRAAFEAWWSAKIDSGMSPIDIAYGIHAEREQDMQATQAALAQDGGIPEGYALVPVDPSEDDMKALASYIARMVGEPYSSAYQHYFGEAKAAWSHVVTGTTQPQPSASGPEAAPQSSPAPAVAPEGCTPADAQMLRAANHQLAAENDYLRRRLRPFAQIASSPLSWAMVEYCIDGDPEKQTLQAPQMQRAFNRTADALRKDAAPAPSDQTVPKRIYDNLVDTLQPAWDYVQTHADQFGARPGDDKNKIVVDVFLAHVGASPAQAEQQGDVPECNGSHDQRVIHASIEKECTACAGEQQGDGDSLAFKYGNAIVDRKLDPSYEQQRDGGAKE